MRHQALIFSIAIGNLAYLGRADQAHGQATVGSETASPAVEAQYSPGSANLSPAIANCLTKMKDLQCPSPALDANVRDCANDLSPLSEIVYSLDGCGHGVNDTIRNVIPSTMEAATKALMSSDAYGDWKYHGRLVMRLNKCRTETSCVERLFFAARGREPTARDQSELAAVRASSSKIHLLWRDAAARQGFKPSSSWFGDEAMRLAFDPGDPRANLPSTYTFIQTHLNRFACLNSRARGELACKIAANLAVGVAGTRLLIKLASGSAQLRNLIALASPAERSTLAPVAKATPPGPKVVKSPSIVPEPSPPGGSGAPLVDQVKKIVGDVTQEDRVVSTKTVIKDGKEVLVINLDERPPLPVEIDPVLFRSVESPSVRISRIEVRHSKDGTIDVTDAGVSAKQINGKLVTDDVSSHNIFATVNSDANGGKVIYVQLLKLFFGANSKPQAKNILEIATRIARPDAKGPVFLESGLDVRSHILGADGRWKALEDTVEVGQKAAAGN